MEATVHRPVSESDAQSGLSDRAFEAGLAHERKRLGATHPLFINGRACRSTLGTFKDLNPADSRVLLGRFQRARADHVSKAVKAARRAFPFWRELGWEQRLSFVRKVADIMESHAHEFAALLCLEAGKTRREAMAEVHEAIQVMQLHGQQMEQRQGFRLNLSGNGSMRAYDTLEPRGVWGILAPGDAPLLAASGLVAAAVLAGNTVVFKPASTAAFTGLRFYDLFPQAGFPVGVVNFLTGPGESVGRQLAGHSDLDGLAFIGSKAAGLAVREQFRPGLDRPCLLLLSANNPVIVMPTAEVAEAAAAIAGQAFHCAGQSSAAWSRVYVHRSVAAEFHEALVERTRSLQVGPPEEPGTDMGPLAHEQAVEMFRRAVRLARKDGRLASGGRVFQKGAYQHGHFVEPTLAIDVDRQSRLHREEHPVPVLAVSTVKSLDEAIRLANQSHYGVAAGLYSQVLGEQQQFFDQIEAGTLFCNRHSDSEAPIPAFGGWKSSSNLQQNMTGPYFVTQFMREQTRHLYS